MSGIAEHLVLFNSKLSQRTLVFAVNSKQAYYTLYSLHFYHMNSKAGPMRH